MNITKEDLMNVAVDYAKKMLKKILVDAGNGDEKAILIIENRTLEEIMEYFFDEAIKIAREWAEGEIKTTDAQLEVGDLNLKQPKVSEDGDSIVYEYRIERFGQWAGYVDVMDIKGEYVIDALLLFDDYKNQGYETQILHFLTTIYGELGFSAEYLESKKDNRHHC